MPLQTANWDSNKDLPVGKGATIQQFSTTLGTDRFEISVAPWGEGQLKVNGHEIARTAEAKDRRHAFATLKQAARRWTYCSRWPSSTAGRPSRHCHPVKHSQP